LDLSVKKELIDMNHPQLSIKQQCALIGLNRSSYYAKPVWLEPQELQVLNRMDEIFTEHPYYGNRRMMHVLRAEGYMIGRKKVRRYYQILGIEAIYPKMNLSKRNQEHKVYPYLLRGLEISKPNQVWSMDITYIRLKTGFVYLCAIIDWHSRYVLSWRLSITLQSDFCIEALQEAIVIHGKPEIFNTDQGVQFTSTHFIQVLKDHSITISMDGKGRALDNVFIERFWRSLKQEKIYRIDLISVKEAREAIKEYMEFYNHHRMHQSLGYIPPVKVHYGQGEKENEIIEEPVDMMDKFYNLPTYPQAQQPLQKNIFRGF
jgi:putative transposase